MKQTSNPLLCDPSEGICEIPGLETSQAPTTPIQEKSLRLICFTDPICSSCWGIEPQLRRLSLEYGNLLEIDYRMGGLLPDWSYNSGGISKPSDVASHWDEVSHYYDMPIDGDVWLENPLHSSYPPSIAFKAAEIQDKQKALLFLRILREMVFLEKKNITEWENFRLAAEIAGLDSGKLKYDIDSRAKSLFEKDLELARTFGVRGFPSLFFLNAEGKMEFVYGSKPYFLLEKTLQKLAPTAQKRVYDRSWMFLFSMFNSLTAREFAELSDIPRVESERVLDSLVKQGHLEKYSTKNGSIWRRK